MPLSDDQFDNLKLILDTFNRQYPAKYTKGAKEHGGNLGQVPALDLAHMLLEEGMDTVAYAVNLIEHLKYQEENLSVGDLGLEQSLLQPEE